MTEYRSSGVTEVGVYKLTRDNSMAKKSLPLKALSIDGIHPNSRISVRTIGKMGMREPGVRRSVVPDSHQIPSKKRH